MIETISVVGIDPGPTTGMCFLEYDAKTGAMFPAVTLQVNSYGAYSALVAMLQRYRDIEGIVRRYGAIEKFVTGPGAGSRGKSADITRDLIPMLSQAFEYYGYPVAVRSAADVKPWATDKRLLKAGIIGTDKTAMRHSYDAGRHALFCAVKDARQKDPLL